MIDLVRSPYYTDCQVYNDSDELIPCRWAKAPDGTLPLPYSSKYGSRNWLNDSIPWQGLGEYPAKPRKHNREPNQYPDGSHCIKRPSVLTQGITQAQKTHPIGLLPCCHPAFVFEATGGFDLSGEALVSFTVIETTTLSNTGIVLVSGSGTTPITAYGGILVSGRSTRPLSNIRGGVLCSGRASRPAVASGCVLVSCNANAITHPHGGVVCSGRYALLFYGGAACSAFSENVFGGGSRASAFLANFFRSSQFGGVVCSGKMLEDYASFYSGGVQCGGTYLLSPNNQYGGVGVSGYMVEEARTYEIGGVLCSGRQGTQPIEQYGGVLARGSNEHVVQARGVVLVGGRSTENSPCCDASVPAVLFVRIEGTGGCSSYDETFLFDEISVVDGRNFYGHHGIINDFFFGVFFFCSGDGSEASPYGWTIFLEGGNAPGFTQAVGSGTCDPFEIVFSGLTSYFGCSGGYIITVFG